jgi:type IV secretory pathway VirJ component
MAQKLSKGRVSRKKENAARAIEKLVAGPTLATARVNEVKEDGVTVVIGRQVIAALRDESVHPLVLKTAARNGERVLVERGEDGVWTVIGALRTQPTPGIELAEEYTIEAERVKVKAHGEVTLVAAATSVVLRGDEGEIESHAPRIVSRADGLHAITGRTLKLN